MKEFVKQQLRRFGFDIGSARQDPGLIDFVVNRGISVVLDVGANVGQFGESLRSAGYRGKIISFEPIPAVFRTLADRVAADDNWEAHNFALGSTAGQATINVSEVSVFSSLLPATRAAAVFDSAAVATHPETIELRTLDEVFREPSGKTLLKIDTQGYEKQVLEGGARTLAGLEGVLMELPIIHLYQRTWQFHEALGFMAERGFVPAQIHPVSFHWKDTAAFVEVDCLFRRRDETLD